MESLEVIWSPSPIRALIPDCKRLASFEGGNSSEASLGTRIRMLRALLPSLEGLRMLRWNRDFELCFVEVRAPYLRTVEIGF